MASVVYEVVSIREVANVSIALKVKIEVGNELPRGDY